MNNVMFASNNVMLRFPTGSETTPATLFERTRLCADAQRSLEQGEDIIVPHGVTVYVAQPGMAVNP